MSWHFWVNDVLAFTKISLHFGIILIAIMMKDAVEPRGVSVVILIEGIFALIKGETSEQ